MLPRQNQKSGNQNKDVKKDVQKELEAENKNNAADENIVNSVLKTGNENAGKILLEADESGADLFGSMNNIFNNADKAPAEKNKNEAKPGAKKNIFSLDDDDGNIFGGFLKEVKKEAKKEAPKEYGEKDPAKNLFPGEKPAKQVFYEDPADLQERFEIQGNEDELINESLLDLSDDISMKNQAGKKKKNDNWRLDRTKKNRKKESDLDRADQTQERIAGLNLTVQKLDKRNKAGRFSRALTNLAIFAGGTIGAALNWVGAAFKRMFSSKYRSMYNRGQSKDTDIPEIEQKKRRHDIIPGWNGETFRKEPDGKDDILADFRRIPTVWSQITAGQAADKNGNPLAPKISIYIRQGKEGEDKSVNGIEPGHAGLGIEYSRYSLISNRYERYNLRYGFFPGSQESKQGSVAMTGNALIPGQLRSEAALAYSVRRTYPATAKQVNAILKASETYADKGYNSFNRNCTTFVKEMIRNEAGIPAGDKIFEQETPGFSSLVNFGMFASKASENTARASIEERFARLGTDNDLNYGGDGNRRVNKQDYINYKDSLAKSKGGYINKADLPNAAAENMRRLEGEDAGSIGSRYYFGTAAANPDTQSGSIKNSIGLGKITKPKLQRDNIRGAITNESNSLIRTILSVTRKRTAEELRRTPGIDRNAAAIIGRISSYGAAMDPADDNKELDPDKLRNERSSLEQHINDLNTLLFSFFKNDARLHMPIMHMISLLEYGINVIDFEYENADIGKDNDGDLRNLRGRMNPQMPMEIKYNKMSDNKNQKVSVKLTPSRYEAYLQIYKSPHKAIDKASRFQALSRKAKRTKAEEAEFQKLKRIDNLSWDYDASHRYMLEKNSYNQQDIDYTFSLEKMEKMEETAGALTNTPASDIYKSLILEKIFGGVTERLENNFTLEEVQDKKS